MAKNQLVLFILISHFLVDSNQETEQESVNITPIIAYSF